MKQAKKVALLGFDCALTDLVRKHIAEGICPNFQKVFDNATVAENCMVPFPTITPPNWTVMATGAWPGTNNVTDFWRHVPGTTPEGYNTHNSFNWDYVQAESIWEAVDHIGKKSVIFNFPMSYNAHKKLKNATVVGGGGLTPGVYMDAQFVADYKGIERTPAIGNTFAFCEDVLIATDIYPGNSVRVKFQPATGWTHVDDDLGLGDDPLEASFEMPFANSLFNRETTSAAWHILVRDSGQGYDTVTLAPGKDFREAFFTVKTGEWTPAFTARGVLEKGGFKDIRLMGKLVSMTDEAEGFRLYLTHGLNVDGDAWCYPQDKAALFNHGNNVATNNTGMFNLSLGWYDLDTWLEQIGIHYDWMGDAAEALLQDGDWDLFYSHAHPTDYIYHVLITDLDPVTCSSQAAYDKAWELHRQLYRHADRYLGRLLRLFGGDTLVTLVADHGATPDGPQVDMMSVMEQAGLTCRQPVADAKWLETFPENVRPFFAAMGERVDASRSRAIPQRCAFVYVNLKGRDPEGIVEPKDYRAVQREIVDALMAYRHPRTGKCPFILALPKEEAELLGLWGDQVGDVVYAYWPEYTMQHGPILPSSSYGIGTLKALCVFYGPELGIRKGFSMQRRCNLVDLVPTFCHLAGWPLPKTVEGSVVYQIMEDPDFRPAPVK